MALSKEESIRGTKNLAVIAQIILGPCTAVLQDVLAKEMPPINLHEKIESFLFDKRHIRLNWSRKDEGRHMFRTIKENRLFTIPLLYACLRCICSIPPHKNNWGNFPDDQDRSLSANIERIYSLHKEYEQYPNYHLKDLMFEHDWENVYETVKELEEFLGSDTKHQKNMKELKTCSMKPNVWEKIIKRLWGSKSRLADLLLELEKYDATCLVYINIETEGIEPFMMESESEAESESKENDKTERTEPVSSKQLKELFSSFEIMIPDDPQNESFASGIVYKDVHDLVTTVNSLSNGIVLSTNTSPNTALIFEMEVVVDGDKLRVVKKDNSKYEFRRFMNADSPTKVILITSKYIPIVKAKLTVYKKYKHVINERKIFLQHEYEEFDDVAKTVAYQELMAFCLSVESVINAFSVDLYKIITNYKGGLLTAHKIRKLCLKAFNESQNCLYFKHNYDRLDVTNMFERFGTTGGYWGGMEEELDWKWRRLERPERDWREWVATKIHQKISKRGEMKSTYAWSEIWKICEKTVDDLGIILSGLEKFHTRVPPVDQNKQIGEWLKREDIMNKVLEHKHPFMTKCIAGQKNGTIAMKIYLTSEITIDAKEAFKKNFESLGLKDFEFINFEDAEEMPEEFENIKSIENNDTAIEESTEATLRTIIQSNAEKLYARYSNIIGIRTGKCVCAGIVGNPCIILYCLDKNLIPLGERKLPETLEGWPCDLREDFIMLGKCTAKCKTTTAEYPVLGCSIGIPSHSASGSVGFMYETTIDDVFQSGFLTASHVAVEECHELHINNTFLSNHDLRQKDHNIVHPSYKDNSDFDYKVGRVVEAFFGTTQLEGLDIAVVQTFKSKKGVRDILEVYDEKKGLFKKKVMKTGRTTNKKYGHLMGTLQSLKMEHPAFSEMYYFLGRLYIVDTIPKKCRFFMPGDSGSGVFVVEENQPDKVLGIGIALSKNYRETYVCKIPTNLNNHLLQLVRYNEQTLAGTNEMQEKQSENSGSIYKKLC